MRDMVGTGIGIEATDPELWEAMTRTTAVCSPDSSTDVRERPQDESAIRSVTEKVKALTLRKPVYA